MFLEYSLDKHTRFLKKNEQLYRHISLSPLLINVLLGDLFCDFGNGLYNSFHSLFHSLSGFFHRIFDDLFRRLLAAVGVDLNALHGAVALADGIILDGHIVDEQILLSQGTLALEGVVQTEADLHLAGAVLLLLGDGSLPSPIDLW